MAEFISEEGGNDKNFILAKLVSVFGDCVDFDVISIVAQENEWNEAKCIELLTVLGEYKNPQSILQPVEIETVQLGNRISDRAVNHNKAEAETELRSCPSFDSMSQTRETSQQADAAPKKIPRFYRTGPGAKNKKVESVQQRHPSPAPSSSSSPKLKDRSSETQEHHDQIKSLIASGTPVLILLRGLPGSGKSTLSKQLLSLPGGKSGCSCSADDFFLVPLGGKGQKEYRFDPLRLEEAHKHCRVQVLRAIAHGVSPIIVDNTNIQAWEMLPYAEMALEPWKAEENLRKMVANGTIAKRNVCNSLGPSRNSFKGKKCNCGLTVMEPAKMPYQVELLEPLTWWYRNPSRLAKVNQHCVSQRKITQMLSHFEYGLTGKDLIKQILKNKPTKNKALHPEPPNHPGTNNVRPFKEKKPSAHLAGTPLFTTRANQGNTNLKNLPNQFVFGNNLFPQPPANQVPNLMGFPPGPFMPPPLYTPNMFNVGSGEQPTVFKSAEAEVVFQREQFHQTTEENQVKASSNNSSIFPGIEPSTLFSSQKSEHKIESDDSSSENASSKSDVIGPNPFLKVKSLFNQDINTSDIYQGECIEITEEEEQEWNQANASKYADWKSSEEEESGDELVLESYEPKPARTSWGRHANLESARSTGKGSVSSDYQNIEGDEEIAEWVTEGDDHLSSWNIPTSLSNSDSHTAPNDNSELKIEGPLPPRSPKKRSPVEDSSKSTDSAEQSEKAPDSTEGLGFDWIKDIRHLLKALGLDRDNSDSTKHSSNDTENTSSTTSATVARNQKDDDPTADSTDQGTVDSDLLQVEVQEEIDRKNATCSKTEETAELDSANVKIQGKPDSEGLLPVKTVPLEIPIEEHPLLGLVRIAALSSFSKVGDNNQVDGTFIAGQPETEKIISSDIPETSGTIKSATVVAEIHDNLSDLKDCDNKVIFNTPEDSLYEVTKSKSAEKINHNILELDGVKGSETPNLLIINDDDLSISSNSSETNSLHSKSEQGKMSVLSSLLIGLEKAQKIRPEEFECSENLPENVLAEYSKSEKCELHLETGQIQSFEGDASRAGVESTSNGEGFQAFLETSVVGPPLILTTLDRKSDERETTEKCPEHSAYKKELCVIDVFPSIPDNFSFIEESLCKDTVVKDPGSDILSSLVSLSSEKSSTSILNLDRNTAKNKTDNFVELNLSEDEKNDSFTIVTNQDAMMHPASIHSSDVLHKCEAINQSLDNGNSGTKSITNLSLKEESLPNEGGELVDQVKEGGHIPLRNSAPNTAQNIFEMAGNYFLNSFGASNEKSPTTDSTLLCTDVGATRISKTISGKEDSVVGEESLPNVCSDSMDAGSMLNCDDDNETYPLVLDPNFVDLLYQTFGNPYEEPLYESPKLTSGTTSGVTVKLPSSIARKLHECLLKSQWDAILAEDEASQKMVIEDELLARQLQELEKEDLKDARDHANPSSNTPNLREIMDMEMAMAMYKADQNKNMQTNQRNDMSARLTWDLLIKEFHRIPQNVIAQIFSAYDYSYANTREALLTSLPEYEGDDHTGAVKEVVSPEAIAAQEKVLLENAKMESLKFQQRGLLVEEESEEEDDIEADEVGSSWKEMVEEARKSAALNKRLQKERHAQAQAANRSGMASAAAYYCQMATLHKQKAEEETRKAANILSKVFTGKYGSSQGCKVGTSTWTAPPPTLDMHSMKVTEAVTVMNAFLDAHIEWLRADKTRQHNEASRKSSTTKTKTLFLVTGRGMNSQGGIPRIKPAVERQLEMRGVWYEEMNPGLLRVMVSANQQTKRKA